MENQGVWSCGTNLEGDDPSVWISETRNSNNWQLVCDSLSQFLVTFILRESMYCSQYKYYDMSLDDLRNHNLEIVPLWEGIYAWDAYFDYEYSDLPNKYSYYLIEDSFLFNNRRCATNYKNASKLLTNFGYRRRSY